MNPNGISLNTNDEKKSRRTAFILTGIAALGIAGALGLGVVIGGRGGNSKTNAAEAAAAAVTPARTLPVSPTSHAAQPATEQPAGQPDSNAGDTSSDDTGDAPAPTNTPVPPAPTDTAVPPTDTPTATSTAVPPTDTPTATATATATAIPCPWCPIIDFPIVELLDFTPPVISDVEYVNCGFAHHASFSVNESSELWVTYDLNGSPEETAHLSGTDAYFDLGGFWIFDTYTNAQLHAVDDSGNEATLHPLAQLCF